MKSLLIAPCGMNCSICMAYLRDKINAPGVDYLPRMSRLLSLNAKLKIVQL